MCRRGEALRAWYDFRRFMLTDGGAYVLLGVFLMLRGAAYLPIFGDALFQHSAELLAPEELWSVVWLTLGAACVLVSRWHDRRIGILVLAASVGLLTMWGAGFAVSGLSEMLNRGVVYLTVPVVVVWAIWRGKRGEIRLHNEGGTHGRAGHKC